MSNEKTTNIPPTDLEKLEETVDEMLVLEQAAQKETDIGVYIHELKTPFVWEGKTYEKLEFRWDALTGMDHLNIESELLLQGKTLVIPEYTGGYLLGMAVRACTERNEKGHRVLDAKAFQALPLGDFMRISKRARTFLLRVGR